MGADPPSSPTRSVLSLLDEDSPQFAAQMEENGGSLTDGETKRRLKICLRSGQEATRFRGEEREGGNPLRSKAKGGIWAIQKISAKYCGLLDPSGG